ncbi:winged helix-turn-helix transcriptional regulator [Methylorubrum extorquens]|uniref:winged helix-turn-helix transcriptional regulator n=1 Tax=Methylorubrum extorquens TaxID=408 RepID=UPI001EE597C6|nr:helix-turn-helix domain-containing protein [Methylorubrum extorquens]MCG5248842.1 helix-turn-helix transcriptional regulator [Methylorubrum extorquens]
MVKRVGFGKAACPVARALDVIGDWWSLLIIRDAFEGVRRFSEFQAGLGIAKGMLATRLRDLTERGVLETAPASDGSAYREYVLTEKGRGLFLVIVALRQWGEDFLYRPDENRSALVDTATGIPVARMALHSAEGRSLTWSETRVRKAGDDRVGAGKAPGAEIPASR